MADRYLLSQFPRQQHLLTLSFDSSLYRDIGGRLLDLVCHPFD